MNVKYGPLAVGTTTGLLAGLFLDSITFGIASFLLGYGGASLYDDVFEKQTATPEEVNRNYTEYASL